MSYHVVGVQHDLSWANFGCIFTTEDPFILHKIALKEIPREILMHFDGSYFIVGLLEVVKQGGVEGLEKGVF